MFSSKKRSHSFECFIGVDQCGASYPGQMRARPLPAACLTVRGGQWELKLGPLESLAPLGLKQFTPRALDARTLILVDAVLWPLLGPGASALWRGFEKASQFEWRAKRYGREVAEEFFSVLLPGARALTETSGDALPQRQCEILARANSVFRARPYQRNIQTGTFRIWKDLGSEHDPWLNVWPFEARPRVLPWIAEGYPSLLWRRLFGLRSRDPSKLGDVLKRNFPKLKLTPQQLAQIKRDPNLADALVLALAGQALTQNGLSLPRGVSHAQLLREGWIFGLEKAESIS